MMWDCPDVKYFWSRVAHVLSDVIGTSIPSLPNVLLLNDDSAIKVTRSQRRLLLLGLTTAKKNVSIKVEASP